MKVGNGLNVTIPVAVFSVYVPSPGTVTVVCAQLFGVSAATAGVTVLSARPQSLMLETCSGNDAEPAVSPSIGDNVWLVS